MSEQADLDELARRYLDLWQDQMTALAGDTEFAEALQQLMATMGQAAPAAWSAWPAMMAGLTPGQQMGQSADGQTRNGAKGAKSQGAKSQGTKSQAHTQDRGSAQNPTAAGSAAAAATPGGGVPDLDVFTRRLTALEKRVASLEAGGAGRGGPATSKSRKSRS